MPFVLPHEPNLTQNIGQKQYLGERQCGLDRFVSAENQTKGLRYFRLKAVDFDAILLLLGCPK